MSSEKRLKALLEARAGPRKVLRRSGNRVALSLTGMLQPCHMPEGTHLSALVLCHDVFHHAKGNDMVSQRIRKKRVEHYG